MADISMVSPSVDADGHTFSPALRAQQKHLAAMHSSAPTLAAQASQSFDKAFAEGISLYEARDPSGARERFVACYVLAREFGHAHGEGDALNLAALCYLDLGQPLPALEFFLGSQRLCESNGDARGAIVACGNAGRALIQLRRYEEAEQALVQAADMAGALADYPMWVHALGRLGTLQLQRRRHAEARKTLAQAVGLAAALDDPGVEAPLLQRLAAAVASPEMAHVGGRVDEEHGEFTGDTSNALRRAEGLAAAADAGRGGLVGGDPGSEDCTEEPCVVAVGTAVGAPIPAAGSAGADSPSLGETSRNQSVHRCCAATPETWAGPKPATAADGMGSCRAAGGTGLDGAGETEAGVAAESKAAAGSTAGRVGQQGAGSQHVAAESGAAEPTAGQSAANSDGVDAGAQSETTAGALLRPETHLAIVHLLQRAVRLTSEGDAGELKLQVRRAAIVLSDRWGSS